VTIGDPSGLWGMMKEGIASGAHCTRPKNAPGANALVKEWVAEMETSNIARDGIKAQLTSKSPDEIKKQLLSAQVEAP
jgi:hypothetical protein